jgi:hypothetical protein
MIKIKPAQCAKEEVLVSTVKAGGVEEVRISLIDDQTFIMSVKIKRTGERLYLATRRAPHEPRKFKRVDVAITAASKLIGAKKFLVTLH